MTAQSCLSRDGPSLQRGSNAAVIDGMIKQYLTGADQKRGPNCWDRRIKDLSIKVLQILSTKLARFSHQRPERSSRESSRQPANLILWKHAEFLQHMPTLKLCPANQVVDTCNKAVAYLAELIW